MIVSAIFLGTAVPAGAQYTGSHMITILPVVHTPQDSVLAVEILDLLVSTIRSSVEQRGLLVDVAGHDLEKWELVEILSQPAKTREFAGRRGAALMLGSTLTRLPGGDILFTCIIYGTDDRKVIATDWGIYRTEEEARASIAQLVQGISRPQVLTPSDTPIFYSLVVPCTGQLMLEQPLHAAICGGLLLSAFTWGRSQSPPNEYQRARWEEKMKKKRLKKIVLARLVNVIDTTILCKMRQEQVDASLFFSVMETYSVGEPVRLQPVIGIRFSFNLRR